MADFLNWLTVAFALFLLVGVACATPITDPCAPIPPAPLTSKLRHMPGKPSPIIAWVTVRSGGPLRIDAPQCTDPVLQIPEPELIDYDVTATYSDLLFEPEPPRVRHTDWTFGGGGTLRHRRPPPIFPPRIAVGEPPMAAFAIMGMLALGLACWRNRNN